MAATWLDKQGARTQNFLDKKIDDYLNSSYDTPFIPFQLCTNFGLVKT